VPKSNIPIISFGFEMIFCRSRLYAHSSAVLRALLPSSGVAVAIEGETWMRNRIASFWSLNCCTLSALYQARAVHFRRRRPHRQSLRRVPPTASRRPCCLCAVATSDLRARRNRLQFTITVARAVARNVRKRKGEAFHEPDEVENSDVALLKRDKVDSTYK
jgi:hypothetical protein